MKVLGDFQWRGVLLIWIIVVLPVDTGGDWLDILSRLSFFFLYPLFLGNGLI